ncbi:hypothetical protein [Pantoea dispersa]|uniref:hypothetical protein n=1 Tax=Pantoea dispersa TaxID=59814 RepID=UPI0032127B91
MTERGMIFNADMVRAILDGSKTQTRRIAPISQLKIEPYEHDMVTWNVQFSKPVKGVTRSYSGGRLSEAEARQVIASRFCPFGQPGDRLWVREAWMPDAPRDGTWADVEFYGCKGSPLSMIPERYRKPEHCIHRASWDGSEMVGWTPSIHMPRWASRITLEITGVRVERLNDISEDDAKAEGAPTECCVIGDKHFLGFRSLWRSIYGADSWQANPWVWVIEFKRVEGSDAETQNHC